MHYVLDDRREWSSVVMLVYLVERGNKVIFIEDKLFLDLLNYFIHKKIDALNIFDEQSIKLQRRLFG